MRMKSSHRNIGGSLCIAFALVLLVSACSTDASTESPTSTMPSEMLDFGDAAYFGMSFEAVKAELAAKDIEIAESLDHWQGAFSEKTTAFGLELTKYLDFRAENETVYGITYEYLMENPAPDFYATVGEIHSSLTSQFGEVKTPVDAIENKTTISDLVEQSASGSFASDEGVYDDYWEDGAPIQEASDAIAQLETSEGADCTIVLHLEVERFGDEAALMRISYRIFKDLL